MSPDDARGIAGRASDALQFTLMGFLFLFGSVVWLAAGFFAVKRAYFEPAGAEAMGPYPYAFAFLIPPAVLLIGIFSELLARRRRRRIAAAYAEAATGTSMTVVGVDYPLIEIGLQPRQGLEYLPEGLRCAPLFSTDRGRVEAALVGRLAGYEAVLADYWYLTVTRAYRSRSSTRHTLTLAAVRIPVESEPSAHAPHVELAQRLKSAFDSGWRPLIVISRDGWLAFCCDGESASAEELRPIIAALAAALSPAPG